MYEFEYFETPRGVDLNRPDLNIYFILGVFELQLKAINNGKFIITLKYIIKNTGMYGGKELPKQRGIYSEILTTEDTKHLQVRI